MKKKLAKKAVKAKNNNRYACEVCGLSVTVDNICNCVDACDIICCGRSMKSKK